MGEEGAGTPAVPPQALLQTGCSHPQRGHCCPTGGGQGEHHGSRLVTDLTSAPTSRQARLQETTGNALDSGKCCF